MRRFLGIALWLIACGVCLAPAVAFWQSRDSNYNIKITSGGGNDPATTAWVNAVVSAGGTVSGTQQTRVNTLIVALKGHGLFAKLDRLWLYAGESDSHQATIDIINLSVGTIHGSATLNASGYTGDGSTGFFDTGFDPSTAGGQYTAAAALAGIYTITDRASGGNQFPFGVSSLGTNVLFNGYQFSSLSASINGASLSTASAGTDGLWALTQLAGTASAYNWSTAHGTSGVVTTTANASPTIATGDIFYLAENSAGTASLFDSGTQAAAFLGGSLSSTDVANFVADLNAYMTAWGVNRF